MKRFELVIEWDENGISVNGENDGFSAIELIALLDIKKNDIMEQFTKCENFRHHRVCNENGEWREIVKEDKTE